MQHAAVVRALVAAEPRFLLEQPHLHIGSVVPEAKLLEQAESWSQLLAEGGPLYAMKPEAYIQDVGTPERLAKAQHDYEQGVLN